MITPEHSLVVGKIYNMRNGKTVRVVDLCVGNTTAKCSDGINRSNIDADRGIVNSSIYSRMLDIIVEVQITMK